MTTTIALSDRPAGRTPRLDAMVDASMVGRVIGVEREYTVSGPAGIVDARAIWPQLTGIGAALDPGDPNARRGAWGGVLTVDGPDAEVVTPPVSLAPGCTHRVEQLASRGAVELRSALPAPLCMQGFSTHINIEVHDRIVVPVARTIARRLALPLMLALDRADSPGILVRPRRGRLEIGGEFAVGAQLRAAVGLVIGITLLAERSAGIRRLPYRLPVLPRPRVVPAVERYGFYVDRRAFGPDLYRAGRATVLTRRTGSVTAGDMLQEAWAAARAPAAAVLAADELALVDALAAGASAIPLEEPEIGDEPIPLDRSRPRRYDDRRRPGVGVAVESATWWRALLRLTGPDETRWLTIPGRSLDQVLDALDAGLLDDELSAIVRRR